MKLLELELSGFKSFAATTRFLFSDGLPAARLPDGQGKAGITAIIGPNGSGKSNFAEAIRWVLGETSLKNIRGRKTDDVIFSGSASAGRKGAAQVRLTLDNESGRLGVDASEVALKRSVTRDGSGEYQINESQVRLFDIHHLLAEAGLGTKSYAVISQGTVDRYLTATPQGRRELFDEATGVKALQLKLHQAQRKLTNAAQKEHELTAIVQELKPRLAVLQRQVERYAQRDALEHEYAAAQRAWFASAWHQHAAAVAEARSAQQASQAATSQTQAAREQIETELLQAAGVAAVSADQHPRTSQRALWQLVATSLEEARQLLASQAWSELDAKLQEAEDIVAKAQATNQSQSKNVPTAQQTLKGSLAQVRDAELAAQRRDSTAEAAVAQAEQALALLEDEATREIGTTALSELKDAAPPEATVSKHEVERLAGQLASLGDIDPLIQKEHEEVAARYAHLEEQLTDVANTRANTARLISSLKKDIDQQFKQQFTAIATAFADYFAQLFDGGTAKLEVVTLAPEQEGEPEQFGIDISAHPPGKKLQHIGALSGGEKALTSLALLLAIISVQQPPFIVLDEVDAALDEANSYRFAEALKEIAQTTQVLVVTHNRETMAVADVLYGITMNEDGVSQVYSVKMEDLQTTAEVDEMSV